jgi:ATP-dependent DNA helicase RecG
MTVFGDLEVSVLDELPPGRCPVQTTVVPASKPAWVARVWERLAEEARDGHQAFVVCPRIAEGPGDQGAGEDGFWAAEDEAGDGGPKPPPASVESTLRLFEDNPALKDLRVAPLHGQMSAEEKARTMAAFQAGQLDALVSTTVIEVGIDVPKATAMVILDADRFGLAQLHQMRGRVGRGGLPGLCLLLSGAEPGTPAAERLAAMERTSDGFELSEVDLRLRREGDVLGAAQTGRGGLKLLRVMRDRELIAQARELATRLVEADPGLARPEHAELRRVLDGRLADREEYLERT